MKSPCWKIILSNFCHLFHHQHFFNLAQNPPNTPLMSHSHPFLVKLGITSPQGLVNVPFWEYWTSPSNICWKLYPQYLGDVQLGHLMTPAHHGPNSGSDTKKARLSPTQVLGATSSRAPSLQWVVANLGMQPWDPCAGWRCFWLGLVWKLNFSSGGEKPASRLLDVTSGKIYFVYIYI